jgi:uncharacterized cupredoxin-like copper-binding protein
MRRLIIPALLTGTVVLSACGSSNDSTSSTSSSAPASAGGAYAPKAGGGTGTSAATGHKLKLKADSDGGYYFEPRKLKSKAGAATLVMNNPSSTGKEHGIAIEGNGVDKDGQIVSPGSTSTVSVKLKPGKYEFYCPVPGHKAKGMEGTLVVS